MSEPVRSRFQSPLPHLSEAFDAAARIIALQRDLSLLKIELRTLSQAKRTIWGTAALIFFSIAFTYTLFWILMALHDTGWSSWVIAWLTAVFFGGLGVTSGAIAYWMGKP